MNSQNTSHTLLWAIISDFFGEKITESFQQFIVVNIFIYRQVSNIRRTLVGN